MYTQELKATSVYSNSLPYRTIKFQDGMRISLGSKTLSTEAGELVRGGQRGLQFRTNRGMPKSK